MKWSATVQRARFAEFARPEGGHVRVRVFTVERNMPCVRALRYFGHVRAIRFTGARSTRFVCQYIRKQFAASRERCVCVWVRGWFVGDCPPEFSQIPRSPPATQRVQLARHNFDDTITWTRGRVGEWGGECGASG